MGGVNCRPRPFHHCRFVAANIAVNSVCIEFGSPRFPSNPPSPIPHRHQTPVCTFYLPQHIHDVLERFLLAARCHIIIQTLKCLWSLMQSEEGGFETSMNCNHNSTHNFIPTQSSVTFKICHSYWISLKSDARFLRNSLNCLYIKQLDDISTYIHTAIGF